MKLIWTRSDILSDEQDLITWAFGHRSSHFAIAFFDEAIFFHSHWRGITIDEYYEFWSKRIKVYEIDVPIEEDEEVEVLKTMIDLHGMLEYDYKFLWWLIKTGAKKKLLSIAPPFFIGEQNPDATICHEALELLPEPFRPEIDFKRAVMPDDLYLMVRDAYEDMGHGL